VSTNQVSAEKLQIVCAWCDPGKRGVNVSHGICRRHYLRQLYLIRGTKVFQRPLLPLAKTVLA
jgi:hypothetical protein